MTADAIGLTPPALHELEAEVMELMWRVGEATCRTALEHLNARSARPRAYTTIMTTMRRLADKGLLWRRREGRSDLYGPSMSRDSYRAARVEAQVQALVEEYGDLVLVSFAEQLKRLEPGGRARVMRLARGD